MKRNVSVLHLIFGTRSSGPPASGKIIKEMPGSVASGTPYSFTYALNPQPTFLIRRMRSKSLFSQSIIIIRIIYRN